MKETKRIQISGVRVQYKDGNRDFEAEAISKASALIKKKTGCTPRNLKIAKKSIDAENAQIDSRLAKIEELKDLLSQKESEHNDAAEQRNGAALSARELELDIDRALGDVRISEAELADVNARISFIENSRTSELDKNAAMLEELSGAVSCDITASGGIKDIGDISDCKALGLYGAICGKSLYSGTLDLKEAIALCK